MFISNLSIRRPVFATVMMLSLVTLGIFSYRQLAVDMFPDVEIPVLSITIIHRVLTPNISLANVNIFFFSQISQVMGRKKTCNNTFGTVSIANHL